MDETSLESSPSDGLVFFIANKLKSIMMVLCSIDSLSKGDASATHGRRSRGRSIDLAIVAGTQPLQCKLESLILAQNERWRRA